MDELINLPEKVLELPCRKECYCVKKTVYRCQVKFLLIKTVLIIVNQAERVGEKVGDFNYLQQKKLDKQEPLEKSQSMTT